jgi:hypothetical protein
MDMIGELHYWAALTQGQRFQFFLGRSLGGIQARSRHITEEKNRLALPEIEPRFHDLSFSDYALPEDTKRGPKEICWLERKTVHIR